MRLADFMRETGITIPQLAEDVGRDRSTVLRWKQGKVKPDFDALVALEKISDGKVTARDFAGEAA